MSRGRIVRIAIFVMCAATLAMFHRFSQGFYTSVKESEVSPRISLQIQNLGAPIDQISDFSYNADLDLFTGQITGTATYTPRQYGFASYAAQDSAQVFQDGVPLYTVTTAYSSTGGPGSGESHIDEAKLVLRKAGAESEYSWKVQDFIPDRFFQRPAEITFNTFQQRDLSSIQNEYLNYYLLGNQITGTFAITQPLTHTASYNPVTPAVPYTDTYRLVYNSPSTDANGYNKAYVQEILLNGSTHADLIRGTITDTISGLDQPLIGVNMPTTQALPIYTCTIDSYPKTCDSAETRNYWRIAQLIGTNTSAEPITYTFDYLDTPGAPSCEETVTALQIETPSSQKRYNFSYDYSGSNTALNRIVETAHGHSEHQSFQYVSPPTFNYFAEKYLNVAVFTSTLPTDMPYTSTFSTYHGDGAATNPDTSYRFTHFPPQGSLPSVYSDQTGAFHFPLKGNQRAPLGHVTIPPVQAYRGPTLNLYLADVEGNVRVSISLNLVWNYEVFSSPYDAPANPIQSVLIYNYANTAKGKRPSVAIRVEDIAIGVNDIYNFVRDENQNTDIVISSATSGGSKFSIIKSSPPISSTIAGSSQDGFQRNASGPGQPTPGALVQSSVGFRAPYLYPLPDHYPFEMIPPQINGMDTPDAAAEPRWKRYE